MVYSRKRIRLKHAKWGKYQERWKWEQNIQTNEHMGPLIKLISWWFSQWAISSVFEFSKISSWLWLCPSWNRHSSVKTLHWFIFARTALSGFQLVLLFSWDAFFFHFFIFCSFFLLFHCAFKTWTLFKMNEIFFFLRKKTL